MEDINLLLSYIETEVLGGKRTIMGNGIIVNGENVLNLVKRIRISLNELDGSNVLAEANDRAQKIVATAEQRKEQILDESIIIAEARAIADKTVREAAAQREQIETLTAQNVIRNLNRLQSMLNGVSTEVDSSIKYFAEQYGPSKQSKPQQGQ